MGDQQLDQSGEDCPVKRPNLLTRLTLAQAAFDNKQSALKLDSKLPPGVGESPYADTWLIRYPAALIFFAVTYYLLGTGPKDEKNWLYCFIFVCGGIAAIRELFPAMIVAALVALALWPRGMTTAALLVAGAVLIAWMVVYQVWRHTEGR
jgi:hypothetical protein